jgi:phosphate/sulfate permease
MFSEILKRITEALTIEWLLGSILYDILKYLILIVLIGGLISIIRAVLITFKILKDNRDSRRGPGKHTADRMIDIWYSSTPVKYYKGEQYLFPNSHQSRHFTSVIDDELKKLGLVEMNIDNVFGTSVSAKRTLRNKIIVLFAIFYLATFIGDGKSYYKNLKKRYETVRERL